MPDQAGYPYESDFYDPATELPDEDPRAVFTEPDEQATGITARRSRKSPPITGTGSVPVCDIPAFGPPAP